MTVDYGTYRRAENIAAVTHLGFGPLYERFSERVSGFPGIYQLCIEAADAFTAFEQGEPGAGSEWIDTLERYVGLIAACEDVPNAGDLAVLAARAWLMERAAQRRARELARHNRARFAAPLAVHLAAAFARHQAADPHCTCNDCIEDFARKSDAAGAE